MLIMVAGGVLVTVLVVWALTRTVEPAAGPAGSVADATTAPATMPPTATQPGLAPPIASTPGAPLAGQAPPPQPAGDRSTVQRIAVEDLRAKMSRNEVTVIDVRDPEAFAARHIPGSLSMPFASVEAMADQIPKDKAIVTYCT